MQIIKKENLHHESKTGGPPQTRVARISCGMIGCLCSHSYKVCYQKMRCGKIFLKMLICFSESRLHPVSLLVSESGIANGATVLSGPGLLLTAMFGCMAQQQPSSVLRLWLMLQQGIIGTMHVEISGSVACPDPHWPQESWPWPSLDTIAGELVPTPPPIEELIPALRREDPTPEHRHGRAGPDVWA